MTDAATEYRQNMQRVLDTRRTALKHRVRRNRWGLACVTVPYLLLMASWLDSRPSRLTVVVTMALWPISFFLWGATYEGTRNDRKEIADLEVELHMKGSAEPRAWWERTKGDGQ